MKRFRDLYSLADIAGYLAVDQLSNEEPRPCGRKCTTAGKFQF